MIGELQLSSPYLAAHYWQGGGPITLDTRDGWLDTGDIVQVATSDNCFYFPSFSF